MVAISTPSEPPTRVYARLLRELHSLVAAGKGDSPDADALRDQMDLPWYGLTDAERERLGGLSTDFYRLAAGKIETLSLQASEEHLWRAKFSGALAKHKWDQLLELLRQVPDAVPAYQVRLMQATCWEALGDLEVASLFRHEATRLNPDNSKVDVKELSESIAGASNSR